MIRFADDAAAVSGPEPDRRPGTPVGTAECSPGSDPADLQRLGDEIAELAAHIHAATYRLLVLLREFDAREGWHGGFRTCAHWLSWRTGIGPGAAREKVRVARALGELPAISAAMEHGRLSFSKARALTRVATADNEAELLEFAAHGTTAHVERLVRAWRSVDRAEEAELEGARHEARSLTLYPDDDGTWVVRGRLAPEVGAVLRKALEAAGDELYREESDVDANADRPSHRQRMADAAGLVAEQALGFDGDVRRADRFQVVPHVTEAAATASAGAASAETGATIAEAHPVLADAGHRVPAETSRRLSCDASVVRMTHDAGGEILHWAAGGATALDNLVLLCRRHHRAVHEGEVRLEDGRFFRADGRPLPEAPEPPRLPGAPGQQEASGDRAATPVDALIRSHHRAGIRPGAHATTPRWNGEPWDLGMAIDGLRRRPTEG